MCMCVLWDKVFWVFRIGFFCLGSVKKINNEFLVRFGFVDIKLNRLAVFILV